MKNIENDIRDILCTPTGETFITRYYICLRLLKIHKYFKNNYASTKNIRCLDVGCNAGYFSKIVADMGINVDAIDNNTGEINYPNVQYYNTDIQNFSPHFTYDIILLFDVYEHISIEDRPLVLKKIYGLLKENGVLIFSGPNCISPLYGAGYCKEKFINIINTTNYFNWHYHISSLSYKNIFKSSNFIIDQWCTNGTLPMISDKFEQLPYKYIRYLIHIDKILSPIFKGLGANYYCIMHKNKT